MNEVGFLDYSACLCCEHHLEDDSCTQSATFSLFDVDDTGLVTCPLFIHTTPTTPEAHDGD